MNHHDTKAPRELLFVLSVSFLLHAAYGTETVSFGRAFAPSESIVKPCEQPFRQAVCLNGSWQFQPMPLPNGYLPRQGDVPELALPKSDGWDPTAIKIPSPWNVNTWGAGREVGAGTQHPYWPSSVYYPSYPAAWDGAMMGWLRYTFRVPDDWADRRIVLHFEAVAGQCQVLVNGQAAGEHFDKYLPFELDVTHLVRRGGENELLVGVRDHRLFDKQSPKYAKMTAPYPCGSETGDLTGIWQDVFLLGLPAVRIDNVFVKSLVDQDVLELEIRLRNDSLQPQKVSLGGAIHPWVNLASEDILAAPEPEWRLDASVIVLPDQAVELAPGKLATVRVRQTVEGRLKKWTPSTPNLYGAVLRVSGESGQLDSRFTRFGWRQLKLAGRDLLLNGEKIQLMADFVHPFGPCTMSRRFVWAWYKMIKDFGGNAVRPHAQVHPSIYLDLADEMGLMVLDETAIFGSSIRLNFEEPEAWRRFEEHYDGMVLRDRNHPSVFGWSFGNELFAIFNLNQVSPADADRWYAQLAELGFRAKRLDPTRDWISCDGDEDLRGRLPVWSKHFGHGVPLDRLPEIDKPMMVGESGGTYYARPKQLAVFNGSRAYESYLGRNEALAIDVYENLVQMARPKLAYFSASETGWFGLEHLPLGYRDFDRLPNGQDGVFFSRPHREGEPGMQPERIPPYVTTLNPGWDPRLPLYKALPMFAAEKAALANPPLPCPWPRQADVPKSVTVAKPQFDQVGFVGNRSAMLGRRLAELGVPLADADSPFTIIDADGLAGPNLDKSQKTFAAVHDRDGAALILIGSDKSSQKTLTQFLPTGFNMDIVDRQATALVPDQGHAWTRSFTLPDLYFAEDGSDRWIMKQGVEGSFVERGRVLLKASNTDWSLFNEAPEKAKCAAVVLYEQLKKPGAACLVQCEHGRGTIAVCTVDYRVASSSADRFWRQLFANMGIRLNEPKKSAVPAFDENHALVQALSIGRFDAESVEAAIVKDFIGEKTAKPKKGAAVGGRAWEAVTSPSRDRFLFHQLRQTGPEGAFATYFSCQVRSPRALDELLDGGPDVPRAAIVCYVSEKGRLFLNGQEILPSRQEPADYRTQLFFENLPLKKGWNHLLIKVASDRLHGDQPGTLAVRITSNNPDYQRQLESSVELPEKSQ